MTLEEGGREGEKKKKFYTKEGSDNEMSAIVMFIRVYNVAFF